VEDDRVDAMTVSRALRELKVTNPLVHLENGEEAYRYLQDGTQVRPCVILLDLNMPRMNGLDFLNLVKNDGDLCRIPVIVLTTSREERDRAETFRLSVAGYMVKPVDYQQFVEVIRTIDLYWTVSETPNGETQHVSAGVSHLVS
jgi:CheY-like chemotaxis protein